VTGQSSPSRGASWATLAATVSTASRFSDADHQAALAALVDGRIRSFPEIMHGLRYLGDARLLDVELIQSDEIWRYHFVFVMSNGDLRQLTVNAATAVIEQDGVA
jgi:hypothetical protein